MYFMLPDDSRNYLDPLSRKESTRVIEGLVQRFGIMKEGVRGIARHSVGKGFMLQLNTEQPKWNAEAEAQWEEYAITPGRFDAAGRRSFYDSLHLGIEQRVFRGEFFASMTASVEEPWTGEPCWQFWDTLEIETPENLGEDKSVFDGVRVNARHRPVEYYTKTGDAIKHTPIPADRMVHWYQPMGVNQIRGESDFAASIQRFRHWDDLEKLVIRHAKTHANLAIVVNKLGKLGGKGAFAKLRKDAAKSTGAEEDVTDVAALEKAFGGAIAYLGENGKAELVTGQSPNDKLEPFVTNLLLPNGLASLGLPVQIFWSIAKMGGPEVRFRLAQADLTFQIFADGLIYRFANPAAYRFLQHRIKTGKLDAPKDPNWASKMGWQTPARITVDNGRDGTLEINQLAAGVETLRSICDRRGISYRAHMRQWVREILEFIQIAQEENVPAPIVDRWLANMPMWRAHPTGALGNAATTESDETKKQKEQDDEEPAAA